jgi:hypothetical protein
VRISVGRLKAVVWWPTQAEPHRRRILESSGQSLDAGGRHQLSDRLAYFAERRTDCVRGLTEVMRPASPACLPLLRFRADPEQEMKTRYSINSSGLSELPGQRDDPIRPRRVRNPTRRTRSLLLMALCGKDPTCDSKLTQRPRAEALGPSEDPEHDMLCADVVVIRRSRLSLRTGKHLSGSDPEAP